MEKIFNGKQEKYCFTGGKKIPLLQVETTEIHDSRTGEVVVATTMPFNATPSVLHNIKWVDNFAVYVTDQVLLHGRYPSSNSITIETDDNERNINDTLMYLPAETKEDCEDVLRKIESITDSKDPALFVRVNNIIKGAIVNRNDIAVYKAEHPEVADQALLTFFTKDNNVIDVFEESSTYGIPEISTDKQAIITYITERGSFEDKYFLNKIMDDPGDTGIDIDGMYEHIFKSSQSWLATHKPPKCDNIDVSKGYYNVFLGGTNINPVMEAFHKYWEDVETYTDVKETCEAFITAIETHSINSANKTLNEELNYLINPRRVIHNYYRPESYNHAKSSMQSIKPTFRIPEQLVDMDEAFNMLNAMGDFKYHHINYDDYDTDVVAINAVHVPDHVCRMIPYYISYKVSDLQKYIPRLDKFLEVVSAKLERHKANGMDFSKCTIDNVTNYVSDRLKRIEILTALKRTLIAYKMIIDEMISKQLEYVSFVDIDRIIRSLDIRVEYMFSSGSFAYRNIPAFIYMIPTLLDVLDNSIQAEDNIKLNAILRDRTQSLAGIAKTIYSSNVNRDAVIADMNVLNDIFHAINNIMSKKD